MNRPAVFLDRDKTLIEDPGYIHDPDQVRLYHDAAEALIRLRKAGYLLVVVTNQSGVARGLITEQQLAKVHERLHELLAARGAHLDAIYSCPYLAGSEAKVEAYRRDTDLRKPGPGMLRKAADDLEIDLRASWMIGDRSRDVEAGTRAGCRTILVERRGHDAEGREADPTRVAESLLEAADMVLGDDARHQAPREPVKTGSPPVNSADPRPSPEATPTHATSLSEVTKALTRLSEAMDRSSRRRRQEDFSLVRLCGTLLQMLAIAVAVWGTVGLFGAQPAAATAKLALAAFLQLATLTLMISNRNE